jgi:group I intron endonuclease
MIKAKINSIVITPSIEKGFVYCAFNKKNDKVYIGYTQTTLQKRISSHYCKAKSRNDSENYFHNALKKYKKEQFEWFIIHESDKLSELKNKETYFIIFFNSNNRKFGYNLTTGGEQSNFNKEVCDKISKKAKERNLNGIRNPFFGKTHSAETKKHWSNVRKGIVNNPNFKNHTETTKLKLSDIAIEKWKDPLYKENMSKKHSKPIRCIENGIVYSSIKNAAAELQIGIYGIKNQLHGRSNKTKGYTFEFI